MMRTLRYWLAKSLQHNFMAMDYVVGLMLPLDICATSTILLACRKVIIIAVSTGSGSPPYHLDPNFYD